MRNKQEKKTATDKRVKQSTKRTVVKQADPYTKKQT